MVELGEQIQSARLQAGLGLRACARRLAISPSYLVDLEHGRRSPSDAVASRIAEILGLDLDEVLALCGRFDEATMRFLRRTPAAMALLRRIVAADLNGAALRALQARVER